jgi:hypothetical protein
MSWNKSPAVNMAVQLVARIEIDGAAVQRRKASRDVKPANRNQNSSLAERPRDAERAGPGFHYGYDTQIDSIRAWPAALKPRHGGARTQGAARSIYGFNRSIRALFCTYFETIMLLTRRSRLSRTRPQTTIRIKTPVSPRNWADRLTC